MSGVLRFDQLDSGAQGKIRANIAHMESQNAPQADIEHYLRDVEHLTPTDSGPVSHGASGSWGDDPSFGATMLDAIPFGTKAKALLDVAATGNSYDKNLSSAKLGIEQYRAENPKKALAGTIIGAAAPALASAGTSLFASGAEEAATLAPKIPLLARILRGAVAGGSYGALQGASQAHGNVDDYVREVEHQGTAGAVFGAATPLVASTLGAGARAIGLPDKAAGVISNIANAVGTNGKPNRFLAKLAASLGTQGQAAEELAGRASMDAGAPPNVPASPNLPPLALDAGGPNVQGLAENIAKRPGQGQTILRNAVQSRQGQMRDYVNKALDQGTGTNAQSGEQLLQQLANEHANIDNTSRIVEEAGFPRAPNENPLQAWRAQMGGTLSNGISALRQLVADKSATAKQVFGEARTATQGMAIDSPTLDAVRRSPAGSLAYDWALAQKANRMSPLAAVETQHLPPGVTPEAWQNSLRLTEERNAAATATREVPISGTAVAGKKQDYTKLGNDDLLGLLRDEQGVLETNAAKPQTWARINEYGDALSGGTLGGAIGRKQAGYAADRLNAIEAELKSRGVDDDLIQEMRFSSPDTPVTRTVGGGPAPLKTPELPTQTKELPDPETLHFMKQRLAKMARLGFNDGQGGTLATQAQGALALWGKVKGELPEIWQKADDATAAKFRLIDANNSGRDLIRTQLNPKGTKALYTSMDAVEQNVQGMSPDEQHAFRVGAQSAFTDYLRSGAVSAKTLASQLQEPTSAMARRLALATGDADAPRRLAQSLGLAYQGQAAPAVPVLSSEARAAGLGLDVLRHGVTAPSNAPSRSLGILARSRAAMNPSEQAALQAGAAQSLRGEFAGSTVASPGRVFGANPERTAQTSFAFPSSSDASRFQQTVSGWDAAQAQTARLTGGSPTFPLAAEEANRQSGAATGVLRNLVRGNIGSAATGLAGEALGISSRANRQKLDQAIAEILTRPNRSALEETQLAAMLRQRLTGAGNRLLPRLAASEATSERQF